jgi:hypothetical protein
MCMLEQKPLTAYEGEAQERGVVSVAIERQGSGIVLSVMQQPFVTHELRRGVMQDAG